MITEVVYTEIYKSTLTALINGVELSHGERSAEKLLDRIDGLISKIIVNPYMFQAIPVDLRYRRAVISKQSSLIYEITDTKIILRYIFDNRYDPVWD